MVYKTSKYMFYKCPLEKVHTKSIALGELSNLHLYIFMSLLNTSIKKKRRMFVNYFAPLQVTLPLQCFITEPAVPGVRGCEA